MEKRFRLQDDFNNSSINHSFSSLPALGRGDRFLNLVLRNKIINLRQSVNTSTIQRVLRSSLNVQEEVSNFSNPTIN